MKTREEYIDKLSSQLKEWSAKIDDLESRIDMVSAEMKTAYVQRLADLKDRRDELSQKIQELRNSSGTAWKTLATGMDIAWDDLKYAVRSAVDKFKKAA